MFKVLVDKKENVLYKNFKFFTGMSLVKSKLTDIFVVW